MRCTSLALALGVASLVSSAALAVDVGHLDSFSVAGELNGWGGGSFVYDNPGTGGVRGANDGFLLVSNPVPINFAARSGSSAYAGDWIEAGATGISFWLRDVGGTGDLEIHLGIGLAFSNFWLNTTPLRPTDEWQQFTITFDDPSQWTRIIGGGSFENALRNADRILFRHDTPPFGRNPPLHAGGLGIDEIRILPTPGAAGVLALGGLAVARRRR